MSDTMEKASRPAGGLKPSQLAWLRENIASFAEAEERVRKADENAARARALIGADKKRRKAS